MIFGSAGVRRMFTGQRYVLFPSRTTFRRRAAAFFADREKIRILAEPLTIIYHAAFPPLAAPAAVPRNGVCGASVLRMLRKKRIPHSHARRRAALHGRLFTPRHRVGSDRHSAHALRVPALRARCLSELGRGLHARLCRARLHHRPTRCPWPLPQRGRIRPRSPGRGGSRGRDYGQLRHGGLARRPHPAQQRPRRIHRQFLPGILRPDGGLEPTPGRESRLATGSRHRLVSG